MSFVERGVQAIIHFDAEWNRQMEELSSLSSEELEAVLKKAQLRGLIGDGGKYVLLFGSLAISDKIPQAVDCIIFPLAIGGAAVGLSAEAYYGTRSRVVKEILYDRGVFTRPGTAIRELFQDLRRIRDSRRK
jgi:hypothetical protein